MGIKIIDIGPFLCFGLCTPPHHQQYRISENKHFLSPRWFIGLLELRRKKLFSIFSWFPTNIPCNNFAENPRKFLEIFPGIFQWKIRRKCRQRFEIFSRIFWKRFSSEKFLGWTLYSGNGLAGVWDFFFVIIPRNFL